jgi:hypothetical protein
MRTVSWMGMTGPAASLMGLELFKSLMRTPTSTISSDA